MKHTSQQVVDFRATLRDRDTVQQAPLPSWVHKTSDERYEQVVHAGEWIAKVLFLAMITTVCAASVWQNLRRTAPERDAIRQCIDGGGNPRVFRNAQGKVLAIGCDKPARWVL